MIAGNEPSMPWNKDEKLNEIHDLLLDQARIINQQTVNLAAQTQRIDHLTTQITSLSTQYESLRTDFNVRWNELPKLYLPRQEHQAMAIPDRILALEEFRLRATQDIANLKLDVQQQVQSASAQAAKDLGAVEDDLKNKTFNQRVELDGRMITTLLTLVFSLASIVLTIILHYIH